MKALGASVDWNERYSNPPRLTIEVDRIPSQEAVVHRAIPWENRTLLIAELDGWVNFFVSGRGGALGGTIPVERDGQPFRLETWEGCWSSGSYAVNLLDPPIGQFLDVILRDPRYPVAGHVTLAFAEQAIERFLPGVGLEPSTEIGLTYEPARRPVLA